ncbi:Exosome complex exonuclease RRP44 [Araneus ventricosus]|uniref:Exosome complex exonuclease RRP44 n=1 Tax=Araneus ventricosus TaxID=182803 RepID=A0A4Y2JYV6_ARAVE|nr:Exosome complex exonuclease RRP44 [Araneus ventricosus]
MLPCTAFIEKYKIRPILKKPELRDDIFCGSSACAECPDTIARLEVFPHSSSHRYKKPHYIIPDSNVLINQFDILGQSAFRNVIILQTVLEELRRRHSPVYSRVRETVSDADRHFYAFLNEHHRYTYTERKPGESYIKRNVRAICNAVKWYQEHLKFDDGHAIDVVLLINDKESSKIADEEGLIVYTFAEYVKDMTKFPYLTDILANVDVNTKNDGPGFIGDQSKFRFPKYQKLAHIQDCLKAGTLIQGKFQASRENYLEGFVFMEGDDESESKSVFIQGYKQINRAVHGDLVAVQILPEDQWTCPSSSVLEETAKTPDVEKNETESKSEIDGLGRRKKTQIEQQRKRNTRCQKDAAKKYQST